jgi:hypothetical protein
VDETVILPVKLKGVASLLLLEQTLIEFKNKLFIPSNKIKS